MKKALTLLAMLAASLFAAADKPTVYDQVSKDDSPDADREVKAALSSQYHIVDVSDSDGYAPPKAKAGHLPRVAHDVSGKSLGGGVTVAFVIDAEGKVATPVVVKSDDKRLNPAALKAMEEWRFSPATLKGKPVSDLCAQEFHFEATPTEFVAQVLEPTGGKMLRPKDWHYAEGHHGPVYVWTVSHEDTEGGKKEYVTGVRVQLFGKVKENTGKSARQYILAFVDGKKKKADKVVSTCDEKDVGLFTRVCLETEEGPFHILYSCFWGSNEMDLAGVVISGTNKELWETYAPAFDKMKDVEIIDMKRFGK